MTHKPDPRLVDLLADETRLLGTLMAHMTMVMAGSASPTPVYQPLPLIFPGPLVVSNGNIKIPADGTYQILGVRATVGTPSVGGPVVADLIVNGESVFTTTANRPTIAAGNNLSTVTIPDVVTITENSLISLDILAVGSTSPGADMCVMVSMQRISQ